MCCAQLLSGCLLPDLLKALAPHLRTMCRVPRQAYRHVSRLKRSEIILRLREVQVVLIPGELRSLWNARKRAFVNKMKLVGWWLCAQLVCKRLSAKSQEANSTLSQILPLS